MDHYADFVHHVKNWCCKVHTKLYNISFSHGVMYIRPNFPILDLVDEVSTWADFSECSRIDISVDLNLLLFLDAMFVAYLPNNLQENHPTGESTCVWKYFSWNITSKLKFRINCGKLTPMKVYFGFRVNFDTIWTTELVIVKNANCYHVSTTCSLNKWNMKGERLGSVASQGSGGILVLVAASLPPLPTTLHLKALYF